MTNRWTVCVLEPCCEKSAPWYDGRERCYHTVKRTPVVTVYDNEAEAVERYNSMCAGWEAVGGWCAVGDYPEPGFRVQPILGSLSGVDGYYFGPVIDFPFPTVELARKYAAKHNEWPDGKSHQWAHLVNVTDAEGVIVWSSYAGSLVGSKHAAGDTA